MSNNIHSFSTINYCSNIDNHYANGVTFTLRVGSSIAMSFTVIGTEKCPAKVHINKTRRVFSLASMSM